MADYRDLVIQDLSTDNLRLETALLDATQDRDTFRDLLAESLTRLRISNEQLAKASRLLRQFMGERSMPPPQFDPWYPALDDPTDTSRMVKKSEIRWT